MTDAWQAFSEATRTRLRTRKDLFASGMTASAVRHRIASGRWQAARRGIYVDTTVGEPTISEIERIQAALLALGPGAVASHASAAILHGIAVAKPPTVVYVTRPPTCRNGRHEMPGIIERAAALPTQHLATPHGIPATSPGRTVVDIARHTMLPCALASIDHALRRGLVDERQLLKTVGECRQWPGSVGARAAVRLADPAAESVLESLSRGRMLLAGLPPPQLQIPVYDEHGFIGRCDFGWPEQRLLGEADGRLKYATPADLWAEKRREDRLRAAGFTVVRWGWAEARHEHWLARRLEPLLAT